MLTQRSFDSASFGQTQEFLDSHFRNLLFLDTYKFSITKTDAMGTLCHYTCISNNSSSGFALKPVGYQSAKSLQ